MKDEWFQLKDYQNHEVNLKGDIRAIRTERLLNTSTNQFGVRYANILNTTTKKYESKSVSVLIATAFHGPPSPEQDTVLHMDGNKDNCTADNLIWANRWHAIAFHKEILEQAYKVRVLIQNGETGRLYSSVYDAAVQTGALPSQIIWAMHYNDGIGQAEGNSFVQRCEPSGLVFHSPR